VRSYKLKRTRIQLFTAGHIRKEVSVLGSSPPQSQLFCSYIRFIPTAETFTHGIEPRSRVKETYQLTLNLKAHPPSATMSPPASSFPISNSRILPLPSPLLTGNLTHFSGSPLPGITTRQQYHSTSNDHTTHTPHHYYYSPHNTVDSYFPTTPDYRRTARSDSKPSLNSISSILSSAVDSQSESSSSSSSPMYYQNCYWGTSPTGTSSTTPRTSSMASTPLSGYGAGPVEYPDPSYSTRDYTEIKEEDGSKRKIRRFVVQ